MAGMMFALLISAGVLLTSNQASIYEPPEDYKKGVDLALKYINAHAGLQSHFLFFSTIQQSQIEAGFGVVYIYQNFNLKPTKCSRGTENADTTKCAFRNDRALIDCVVCYKTYQGKMEPEPKPYVNCIRKPELTEEKKTVRMEFCNNMAYTSGSPTLLLSGKLS